MRGIIRGAARVAIAVSCLAIIAALRLFAAPGGGLDNAPAKRRNPNAGKRKAAKRARKARKNVAMHKLIGGRPWGADSWGGTHDALGEKLLCQRERHDGRACQGVSDWCMCEGEQRSMHRDRMEHLRVLEGFKQMSTIAGYFQTHDVTDVLNCLICGGRGTWNDDEKGPTMCLRCKGKGRVIFCKPQWIKYVPSADRYEQELRRREK